MYSDIAAAATSRGGGKKSFELPGKGKGGKKGARIGQGLGDVVGAQGPSSLKEVLAQGEMERVLKDDAQQKEYRRRQGEIKTTLHWNERKLLLVEAEFLTNHAGTEKATVIYVGAAPATHLPLLSKMFPAVSFILVGTEQPACPESRRTKIILAEPTTDLLTRLNDSYCKMANKVLFICKNRQSSWDPRDPGNESWAADDLQAQHDMVKCLPSISAALLKFRLPYTGGTTEYPSGKIYLPVWGGQTSTEARLLPDLPLSLKRYDHKKHEEQMFYFNTVTRLQTYPKYGKAHGSPVTGVGYDWRYDCTAEIDILMNYVGQHGAKYFEAVANERENERRKMQKAKEQRAAEKGRKRPLEEKEEPREADPLAHLIIKRSADLEESEKALLVSKLSEEISADLSQGRFTLETQGLTVLHEPRSKEQPFNQTLKKKAGGGTLVRGSAQPAAAPKVVAPAEEPAKPVDKVLSSLGVDLGDISDSDSDMSSNDESEAKPAEKRRRVEVPQDHVQATTNKALEGYIKSLANTQQQQPQQPPQQAAPEPVPEPKAKEPPRREARRKTPSPPRQSANRRSRFGRGGSEDS